MKFGQIRVGDADGAILAHTLQLPEATFKKGRRLSAADVLTMTKAGIDAVIVAQLEPGDVAEDEAASRVAAAAAGSGANAAAAFTGRANLFADYDGLAVIAADAVAALNSIDEALTIATVAPYERVHKGQMLATIKVITFSAPEAAVARAEQIALNADGMVRVSGFYASRAGLILTALKQTKPSVLEKRVQVTADRLASLGSKLDQVITVPHDSGAVAAAMATMASAGLDPILVFAASAIVDRGDVIPAALVQAGGVVEHLGLPVDPGNLAMLGRLRTSVVIGVPSCAASPALNGFDWLLERVVAHLAIDKQHIARMGVGGLLKEIATRPQPRSGKTVIGARSGKSGAEPRSGKTSRPPLQAPQPRISPSVAVVVLAAGRGTRMQGAHKLTVPVEGCPMVRHAVLAALASRARPVIVVTGHEADLVREALAGLAVTFVHNERFADGQSTSLGCGIAVLPEAIDGAIVMLGDMPKIDSSHINALIAAFEPHGRRSIVAPMHQGRRGNPVLWGRTYFEELQALDGDQGAKSLLSVHRNHVELFELATDAIFLDLDTPEAVAALNGAEP